jgi:two-component system, OmpR family, sensor histidine kinase CreC
MKLRHRILIAFMLLTGGGIYYLVDWFVRDLRPRYLEAVEECLIDSANLLAEWLAQEWQMPPTPENASDSLADSGRSNVGSLERGGPDREALKAVFSRLRERQIHADIYGLRKTRIDLRAYVTDATGKVIFDSEGLSEGKDFSAWRDVALTLKGQYGARSTRRVAEDPATSELYVAAPVFHQGKLVGVVTVCKPTRSINLFLEVARGKALWAGIFAAVGVALAGLVLIVWITQPLRALTEYALSVRDGKNAQPPPRLRGEMLELSNAYEEMRKALDGKHYVENYVQSLTHALKSPLASIQGSAELLSEDMPETARKKFTENIRAESARMRETVDRMLSLAGLEAKRTLTETSPVNMATLAREVEQVLQSQCQKREVTLAIRGQAMVQGDALLLRTALQNLVENALAFVPVGGAITVSAQTQGDKVHTTVTDNGPGLPEYARSRMGERFFSLPHADTGRKGTGLGIAWVQEVTRLHAGRLAFANRPEGGLAVTWELPAAQQSV